MRNEICNKHNKYVASISGNADHGSFLLNRIFLSGCTHCGKKAGR